MREPVECRQGVPAIRLGELSASRGGGTNVQGRFSAPQKLAEGRKRRGDQWDASTCGGSEWVDLWSYAESWLAADSGRLPLGLQDVSVLGDHEDRDEVDHSQSQELGLLTVVLRRGITAASVISSSNNLLIKNTDAHWASETVQLRQSTNPSRLIHLIGRNSRENCCLWKTKRTTRLKRKHL